MGFVVLHMEKGAGADNSMTLHIERDSHPKNADESRTYLNKELIEFPEGVNNRTEAIQYRLKTAELKRKIGKNQVQAIRIILSASPEDMERIRKEGKLDEWCKDSLDYLKHEFGEKNIVSAVLHDDEQTPHIHATLVPIVTGERRKLKNQNIEPEPDKKRYKKKDINASRLCADDVMARNKLIEYQDNYADAMKKYELERGVRGSEARHIGTQEYYRDLYSKNEGLKESIEILESQKEVVSEKISDMYDRRDEAKEKFLTMDQYVQRREKDITEVESRLEQLRKEVELYKAQDQLNVIHNLFPIMKEQLRIANFCAKIGLGVEYIRVLLEGKSLSAKSYSFFSPEHNQKFEATDVKVKIEKESDNPNKLMLTLNGTNILDWFKLKYKELLEKVQPNRNKSKGLKL